MIFYTDGACKNNPGPGGYAFVVLSQESLHTKTESIFHAYYGRSDHTTNNIMELLAMLSVFNYCLTSNISDITIYCDSKYVVDGIYDWLPNWKVKNWRNSTNQVVKNLEIWQAIDKAYQTLLAASVKIKICWIKAHTNNFTTDNINILGNHIADTVAVCSVNNHQNCICKQYVQTLALDTYKSL